MAKPKWSNIGVGCRCAALVVIIWEFIAVCVVFTEWQRFCADCGGTSAGVAEAFGMLVLMPVVLALVTFGCSFAVSACVRRFAPALVPRLRNWNAKTILGELRKSCPERLEGPKAWPDPRKELTSLYWLNLPRIVRLLVYLATILLESAAAAAFFGWAIIWLMIGHFRIDPVQLFRV